MELNERIYKLKYGLIESVREVVRIKNIQGVPKRSMPYGEGEEIVGILRVADNPFL